jgi:tRNA pseudouridine32 synthase/23S rRNA pseudouridine746 synthase
LTPPLTPLHIDPWLLVFDKPAGLLCVPGRGPDKQDCLSARAQAQWPDALIVHRLDMATSGLVLMARGIEAQRALSLAFEQRRVHKRYTAVVTGRLLNPAPDNGWSTIDLPLLLDWQNRPRSIVSHAHGKPSLTRWRLATARAGSPANTTRLDLEPVTGRSHQLRVHLQAIGHPIVGDPLYAAVPPHASQRLLLHALALACPHPHSGEAMHFVAPCPF